MKEVLITGEIVPFQDAWIEESGYTNLSVVKRQLEEAKGEDVKVIINSYGGDVDEGFAIYSALRSYAKTNDAKINTTVEGRCASIATVIFLAGDTRLINPYVEPFVHNAWCYAVGDSKQIQRVAADLDKCNSKIADHYAAHTDLSKEEALALMEAETSITPDECVKIRFATAKEEIFRPVALSKILNKNRNMSNKNKKSIWNKIQEAFKEEGILNKMVSTADAEELDFYELEDDDTVKVGDKARIGGQNAEGEYKVPHAEDEEIILTYRFENGELMEIIEPEVEVETEVVETEEMASVKKENENLTNEILNLKKQLEEKDNSISNLETKNAKYKNALNKIKDLESQEEIPTGEKQKDKPKASSLGSAITNLKNKKKNGL